MDKGIFYNVKQDLDYTLGFTELYKSEPDPALCEAKCLAMQVPYVLGPIGDEDLIVGYMKHGFVGFSPQYGGSYTYYYWDDRVADTLEQVKDTVNGAYTCVETNGVLSVERLATLLRGRYGNIVKTKVMPYHDIGAVKWKNIGKSYLMRDVKVPSKEQIAQWRSTAE